MPELITGGLGDPGDRGGSDPEVAAALSAFAAGQGSEHAALSVLAGTRLLVPVVAVPAEATGGAGGLGPGDAAGPTRPRREKASEMALPTLVGSDGRLAVLAFTCLRSLTLWRRDARPVPVSARQAWQAGVQEASAVVIDVAGPVPLAVDGARLAALAEGGPPPLPHEDPDVQAPADAAMTGEPLIAGFALLPGENGSDLTIHVTLAHGYGPGHAAARAAIQRAVERIAAGGGGRVRRGITVTASTADRHRGAARPGIPGAVEGGSAGGAPAATSGTPEAGAGGP